MSEGRYETKPEPVDAAVDAASLADWMERCEGVALGIIHAAAERQTAIQPTVVAATCVPGSLPSVVMMQVPVGPSGSDQLARRHLGETIANRGELLLAASLIYTTVEPVELEPHLRYHVATASLLEHGRYGTRTCCNDEIYSDESTAPWPAMHQLFWAFVERRGFLVLQESAIGDR